MTEGGREGRKDVSKVNKGEVGWIEGKDVLKRERKEIGCKEGSSVAERSGGNISMYTRREGGMDGKKKVMWAGNKTKEVMGVN